MMPAAVPSPLRTNLPSALMDLKCCSQQQGQVRAQPGKSVMLFPYPSHTKWPCSAHCGKAMLLPLPPENHPHSHINHFRCPSQQDTWPKASGGTYKIKLHYLLERSKFYLAPGCHYAPLLYADNSHLQSDNDFDTFQK